MKKLLLLLFFIPNLAIAEASMIPLAKYIADKDDWQSNFYEVFYVTCRCALLYAAVHKGSYGIDEKHYDKEHWKKSWSLVDSLEDYIDQKEPVYSDSKNTYILERTLINLWGFYSSETSKNHIGDNQFKGVMYDDLITCEKYDKFFESLLREAV